MKRLRHIVCKKNIYIYIYIYIFIYTYGYIIIITIIIFISITIVSIVRNIQLNAHARVTKLHKHTHDAIISSLRCACCR